MSLAVNNNNNNKLKILSAGERLSGKSSLIVRKVKNTFGPDHLYIGVEFYSLNLNKEYAEIQVQLWDIHSSERFRKYPAYFYRKSNALIIIYDITSRNSFEKVQGWVMDTIEKTVNFTVSFLIVGTKADLEDERQVSKQEGQQLADSLGVLFYETSSKLNHNVEESFDALFETIINTQQV